MSAEGRATALHQSVADALSGFCSLTATFFGAFLGRVAAWQATREEDGSD